MTPEERRKRLAELEAEEQALQPYLAPAPAAETPEAPSNRRAGSVSPYDWSPPALATRAVEQARFALTPRDGEDTTAAEAGAYGAAHGVTLGLSDGVQASLEAASGLEKVMATTMPGVGHYLPYLKDKALDAVGLDPEGKAAREAREEDIKTRRLEVKDDHEMAYMAGELAGYLVPGSAGLKVGSGVARAATKPLVSPAVRRAFGGTDTGKKLARYTTQVLPSTAAAGAVDYGIFKSTVEAGNEAGDVSLADRGARFVEGATDPLAFAFGPGASVGYRAARGLTTTAKNTAKATQEAGRLRFKPGSFTPSSRAVEVDRFLHGIEPGTPRDKALKMVHKRLKQQGMGTDDVRALISNYHYNGYSTVDEMLFELAGASNDQLAVALGTVGKEAQTIARERLTARTANAPARIRTELRAAMGLEGDDFYSLQDELYKKRLAEPEQLYEDAYRKTIRSDTWYQTILPALQDPLSGRGLEAGRHVAGEAIDDAITYARGTGELQVARELAEFRKALDSAKARPQPLSVRALDYIDRQLGDMAASIRSRDGRHELAKAPMSTSRRIRGDPNGQTGLDAETGLNVPRDLSAEYRAAGGLSPAERAAGKEGALQFGRKAFAAGTDIETMLNDYAWQAQQYGIDGNDSEVIRGALLMGWLRGAEDKISTATNPGTLIRQIYGSSRQREKLLAMLPDPDNALPGEKAAQTKRKRALVGGKRADGKIHKGRLERERDMFTNQDRIIRNSQTAQRTEAVAEQGGAQDKMGQLVDMLTAGRQALTRKAMMFAGNRMTRPGIYDDAINAELGDILFTNQRKPLLAILDEIDNLNTPRGGNGPKPPAPGPSPATGGAAAAASSGETGGRKVGHAGDGEAGSVSPAAAMDLGAGSGAALLAYYADPDAPLEQRLGAAAAGLVGGLAARRVATGYKRGLDQSKARTVAKGPQLPEASPDALARVERARKNAKLTPLDETKKAKLRTEAVRLMMGEHRANPEQRPISMERVYELERELAGFMGWQVPEYASAAARDDALTQQRISQSMDELRALFGSEGGGPVSGAGFGDVGAPGRAIARILRGMEDRLRAPDDPRRFAGALEEMDFGRYRKDTPAIEMARNSEAAADAVGTAAGNAENVVGRTTTATGTGLAAPSAYEDVGGLTVWGTPARLYAKGVEALGRAGTGSSATAAANGDRILPLGRKRRAAAQGNAEAVQQYRNGRVARQEAAEAGAKVRAGPLGDVKAAQAELSEAKAALFEFIHPQGAHTQHSTKTAKRAAQAQLLKRVNEAQQALAAARDELAAVPRVARPRGEALAAEIDQAMMAAEIIGQVPSLRALQRDAELIDLLLNPARAREAAEIARSGLRMGTHEAKGQAIAAALLAAGIGTGVLRVNANKADDRRQYDSEMDRLWETRVNYGDSTPDEELAEIQAFLNIAVDADLRVDGAWGPKTASAIKQYQSKRDLVPNGKLNGITLDAIRNEMGPAPTPEARGAGAQEAPRPRP